MPPDLPPKPISSFASHTQSSSLSSTSRTRELPHLPPSGPSRMSEPNGTWKNPLDGPTKTKDEAPPAKRPRISDSSDRSDRSRRGHRSGDTGGWDTEREMTKGWGSSKGDDTTLSSSKYDSGKDHISNGRDHSRYDDRRDSHYDSRSSGRDGRAGRYDDYDRKYDGYDDRSYGRFSPPGGPYGRDYGGTRDYRDERDRYGSSRDDRSYWDGRRRSHDYPTTSDRSRRDSSRDRNDRHHESDRSYKRRYSSRSPSRSPRRHRGRDDHKRQSPTRSPSPEDGEISDTQTRPRPATPPLLPDPPIINPYSNNAPHRQLKIRDRPQNTKPQPPPPSDTYAPNPPSAPQSLTPPPPPEEAAPPLPTSAQPPKESQESQATQASTPPRNKALDAVRTAPMSAPHAPNRNLVKPSTRASTPQPSRVGVVASLTPCPKGYRRPTLDQEEKAYGRVFKGTSSLMAYDLGAKLGEGTFGVVTKGVERLTKAPIALKKLIIHNQRDGVSVTTIREIKILKSLHHPNVVPILNMVVEPSKKEKSNRHDVFMVFPYMDHDLCGLLANPGFLRNHSMPKLFMKQLLEGIAHIHDSGFLHRDIKTANLLIKHDGTLMIADFGLARAMETNLPKHSPNEYTNMVVTRWYRAPELLLGDTKYGPAVDMWSIGCVLGEIYKREPILPGGPNDEHQLIEIATTCGPWNEKTFPGWTKLPGFPGMEGHKWDQYSAGDKEPRLSGVARSGAWGMMKDGIDLMLALLQLDPKKRPSPRQALKHAWFTSGVQPEKIRDGLITVSSSHEMTMKQNHPPPAPAQRPRQSTGQPGYGMQRPPQFGNGLHGHGGHGNYGHAPGYPGQPQQPFLPQPTMQQAAFGPPITEPAWANGRSGSMGNPYAPRPRPQMGIPSAPAGPGMHRGGLNDGYGGGPTGGLPRGGGGGPPSMPFKLAGGKPPPPPFALAGSGANRPAGGTPGSLGMGGIGGRGVPPGLKKPTMADWGMNGGGKRPKGDPQGGLPY